MHIASRVAALFNEIAQHLDALIQRIDEKSIAHWLHAELSRLPAEIVATELGESPYPIPGQYLRLYRECRFREALSSLTGSHHFHASTLRALCFRMLGEYERADEDFERAIRQA